jgi:RND family efflux transporter MFP subunit
MKVRRYLFIFAGIVALAVVIYFLLFNQAPTTQVTVKVTKGSFPIEVTTTGELIAKHSEKILGPDGLRQIQIYQVKIVEIIPDGSIVDSGQFVATLDRSEISNKIKDEETNLEKFESQMIKTKLDTSLTLRGARDELVNLKYDLEQRQLELDQSKYEPPATIRQAQIALEKANRSFDQAQKNYRLRLDKALADMQEVTASYKQAQRKVEQMQALLEQFTIKAPKAGMVVYVRGWNGVKSGVGSSVNYWDNYTVAELPDLRQMISKTYVNEIDISKVKVGQKVKIGIDAFPDKSFSGKVTEVANIGEQLPNTNAKVFEVKIQVNEFDSILRPSMTTKNTIETAVLDNVLFIPMEALFNDDSVSYVFRKHGSSVIKQQVVAGLSNDNDIIIRAGLSKDDQVLLVPPDNSEKLKMVYLPPQIVKKFEANPPALPVAKPPLKDTLAKQSGAVPASTIKN